MHVPFVHRGSSRDARRPLLTPLVFHVVTLSLSVAKSVSARNLSHRGKRPCRPFWQRVMRTSYLPVAVKTKAVILFQEDDTARSFPSRKNCKPRERFLQRLPCLVEHKASVSLVPLVCPAPSPPPSPLPDAIFALPGDERAQPLRRYGCTGRRRPCQGSIKKAGVCACVSCVKWPQTASTGQPVFLLSGPPLRLLFGRKEHKIWSDARVSGKYAGGGGGSTGGATRLWLDLSHLAFVDHAARWYLVL